MLTKEITNFPGYLISTDGTVYSDKGKKRKSLSPRYINGYATVVLSKDKKQHVKYIHKLVAFEFLLNDDPENKTEVIHLDGNRKNNDVSNLEWVKKGGGASYYYKTQNVKRNKFEDIEHIPGQAMEETFIYQEDNKKKDNQKSEKFQAGVNHNKYFYYNNEYHKVTDTGQSLVIRVKDADGNWTMKSVARIVMEEYLKKPQPTPNHRIGYKDFDYRNITPINIIWETPGEKIERHRAKFPWKYEFQKSNKNKKKQSNKPELFHNEIFKLRLDGKNYRKISEELKISYYTLYRYCKENGI